jgi:two-component system, OmpR family, sensor histidine kinase QseC
MKGVLRPTLVRRVILALLIGFVLVWVALITVGCLTLWRQQEHDRHDYASSPNGQWTRLALGPVEEPTEARAIVAAQDRLMQRDRERSRIPGAAIMQLWDRKERRLLYSSPGNGGQILHGNPNLRTAQVIEARTYQVFEADTPRWSVCWGRAAIDIPWLLKAMSDDMITNMLIAFPCVLLPALLAVSRGLRPLRQLSERIAARGHEDLSPVGVDAKYEELKPLVAGLDDLLERLRHKIASEQSFVANAAHEMRTPLAVITAQAHVLSKAASESERIEAEQRLENAIARASHLIHQLLVLARIEAERRPEPGVVDLAQLVREQLVHFVPAAMKRNIEIALEAPDRLMLPLEVNAVHSILQNLVDNAIRYGHDGGRIVVELQTLGYAITLSVTDDGPGIAESERARIFDRFYRGANRDDAPGTGLGLTIVKQAAARLNGVIQVTGGLDGAGCSFALRIPTRQPLIPASGAPGAPILPLRPAAR